MKMIERGYPVQSIGFESRECEPDPEKMLKNIRSMLAEIDEAEKYIIRMTKMRVSIRLSENGHGETFALGSLREQYFNLKDEENYWLEAINKG